MGFIRDTDGTVAKIQQLGREIVVVNGKGASARHATGVIVLDVAECLLGTIPCQVRGTLGQIEVVGEVSQRQRSQVDMTETRRLFSSC